MSVLWDMRIRVNVRVKHTPENTRSYMRNSDYHESIASNRGRALCSFAVLFFLSIFFQPFVPDASSELEQLILFVQTGASEVDSVFQNRYLPEIRKMAEEKDVQVNVLDVKKGAPPEVTITPTIVYQNYRGRSLYQGRSTTLTRIRNFMRTSRFVPQGKADHFRGNIAIWNNGRTQIWAPLKVAAVTGTKPDAYNHTVFVEEARASISKGFRSFTMKQRVELGRSDRGFYMDFYPWLSEGGTLFLSCALFSQFHCKKPVFELKDKPLAGPWKDRNTLFKSAATAMEQAVQKIIKDPVGGDGFDVVPLDLLRVSWKDLGFPLPQAPDEKTADFTVDMEIPRDWLVMESGVDDPPMIQFRFPAPLDNYSGEVTKARGEVYLSEDPRLTGTTGFIEVDPHSVTMGETQLDHTIQGSLFLSSKKYPKAKFVIDSLSTDGPPLGYGRLSPVSVSGIFSLKGKSRPLTFNSEVEPIIGKNAAPQLLVRGSFQIDLRDFNIEGADGPEPEKYTLAFDIYLKMRKK